MMRYLEERLNGVRGEAYCDIRVIVHSQGKRNILKCVVRKFFWARGNRYFCCTKIKMDVDGRLYFYEGDFCINSSQLAAEELIFIHDELVKYYDKC